MVSDRDLDQGSSWRVRLIGEQPSEVGGVGGEGLGGGTGSVGFRTGVVVMDFAHGFTEQTAMVISFGQLGVEALEVTLDCWPSQIGVAMTTMFASRIFARIAGHSLPSPSSIDTPKRTLSIRTISPSVLWSARAASTSRPSNSELEGAGDYLSEQPTTTARRVVTGRVS